MRSQSSARRIGVELYNQLMPTPVLATKFYIPTPRSKIVLRPRLVERLNRGISSGRTPSVTLISAPAGFGKTTLASEWVLTCKQPIAWLSIDERDGDLKRFLSYLVTALQTIAPEIGMGVLNAIQSPHMPELESLLTTLINEINSIPNNFILVLDDFHMLDSKPVDQALNFLVEHLPQQMHLVIATREDPPLPLSRLRARNQLTELRAADLRFTPAEAAEFLNQVMGLNLAAENIAALEVRTEGWIAGLQLAALSMQGNASQDVTNFIRSFTGAHHFVLDYLLEEVLHQQPENIQAFLLQTSILNRLCGPLCDAVLIDSSSSGQETLESLERANLFIVALDNERHWYRYHHLFGDLLRQRQGQNLKPEVIAQYHIRASDWYEQNGEGAEAFQHAIAARDFSRAAGLAEKFWYGMNQSFQSAVWLGWVKQLPESLIRTRPVLCVQIGWAFMDAGDVESSESRLRDAELCLEGSSVDEKEIQTLPARIAFARAYNAQTQRDFSATVKFAELAIKLSPEGDQFTRAGAAAILGGSYWASGDLDAACKSMSDWIESSMKAGNFIFSIASESGKAEILTAQGHLREALRMYEQSLQLASTYGSEVKQILAHHHLGLALLHHEMGADESAAQYFQQSMELGQQSTLVEFPYRMSLAQARLKESEGDLDAALEFLNEAKRLFISTPIPNTRPIEALKARIYLKQGQLSKAQDWVIECGVKVNDELSYLREFEHITLAQVLISEDKILDAVKLLSRLLQTAEHAKRMGSMIEILKVQALAFRANGESSQALTSLKRALTLAEPEGYFRFFVNEGKVIAELLAALSHAREDDRLNNYIRKLLNVFDKTKPEPANSQPLIDPLSERELEVLRLVADGLSNDEIGQKLFLSVSTVKGHNLRIFGKLQAKSRTEAVVRARELGLLP